MVARIANTLILVQSLNAEIVKCTKILDAQSKIENQIRNVDHDQVLIIFDIDLTLIKAEHPAMCRPNIQKYSNSLKQLPSPLTAAQRDILLNLAIQKSRWSITEEETSYVVKSIIRKGAKVIALTASLSGKVGGIQQAEVWRFKNLKKIGFDFSTSFPCNRCLHLHESSIHLERYPTFYKGILFSNGNYKKNSKGEALLEFLKSVDFEPSYVVMVDDVRNNLKSVENTLAEHNPSIKFLGVEYTAGAQYKSQDISARDFITFWSELLQTVKDEYH